MTQENSFLEFFTVNWALFLLTAKIVELRISTLPHVLCSFLSIQWEISANKRVKPKDYNT